MVQYVAVLVLTFGSLLSVAVAPRSKRVALAAIAVPTALGLVFLTVPAIADRTGPVPSLVSIIVAPLFGLILTLLAVAYGLSRLLDSIVGSLLRPWLQGMAVVGVAGFFGIEFVPWLAARQGFVAFAFVAAIVLGALVPALTVRSRVARIVLGLFGLFLGHALFALALQVATVSHNEGGGLIEFFVFALLSLVAVGLFVVGVISAVVRGNAAPSTLSQALPVVGGNGEA